MKSDSLTLREATLDDSGTLLNWANDPEVRENSFNTEEIAYDNHCSWFSEKLSSSDCVIFICEKDQTPVGQIRVDIESNTGQISFSIGVEFRGQGMGTQMLLSLPEALRNAGLTPEILTGKVKPQNKASCRAFEKAGYTGTVKKEYIQYAKPLGDKL